MCVWQWNVFLFVLGACVYDINRCFCFGQVVSYLVFLIFVVIMTILIMNLLVGLAVDDIKLVQEQAVLKRMAMQVSLSS